ncbi:MAG: helix-turn-helix domain-containing protein [Thermoplasmata archaeon]
MAELSRLMRKGACCHDLLSNLFELSDSDLELFFILLNKSPLTVDEISDACGRHRSTVFRILQKLEASGLIYRETANIREGGYYHEYIIQEAAELQKIVQERADDLIESIKRRILEFSEDIKRSSTVTNSGQR